MICPKCHAEYVSGVTECYDCGVDLAYALTPEPIASRPAFEPRGVPAGPFSLVTVFATTDAGLMGIARTMLESAQIPLVVEGQGQTYPDLEGPGLVSTFRPGGLVSLRVAPHDADDAKVLLAELIADAGSHDVAHS